MKAKSISFQPSINIDKNEIRKTPNEKLTCKTMIILLALYPTTNSLINE
jgi:hypothetical protein